MPQLWWDKPSPVPLALRSAELTVARKQGTWGSPDGWRAVPRESGALCASPLGPSWWQQAPPCHLGLYLALLQNQMANSGLTAHRACLDWAWVWPGGHRVGALSAGHLPRCPPRPGRRLGRDRGEYQSQEPGEDWALLETVLRPTWTPGPPGEYTSSMDLTQPAWVGLVRGRDKRTEDCFVADSCRRAVGAPQHPVPQ